jgi:hypothetical protein
MDYKEVVGRVDLMLMMSLVDKLALSIVGY